MFRIETAQDVMERETIARRRRLDEERKQRIFDPKTRCLGIDVKALEEQIALKRAAKQAEKERSQLYDQHTAQIVRLQHHAEETRAQRVRQHHLSMDQYRATQQQPQSRREFDLNDPDALKKTLPARLGAEDPRCGVSSLQVFYGEDLQAKERYKEQQRQMRTWTLEQTREKELLKRQQELQKQREDENTLNSVRWREHLEQEAAHARQSKARQTLQENAQMARERQQREYLQRVHETELNTQEIMNQVNGALLLEDASQATSVLGAHRVRTDFFKGMSDAQKQAIYKAQEEQRRQVLEKEERERRQKEEDDRIQAAMVRRLAALEAEREAKEKQILLEQSQANAHLAEEAKQRRELLDKVIYTNKPTEAYFSQFNTTSR